MTKDCKEVFTRIYAEKVWGDGSGGGSGEQAQPYCDFVSAYIGQELAFKCPNLVYVLDIGCGDGSVAARIKALGSPFVKYAGVDASEFGLHATFKDLHSFTFNVDALTDELPDADLVLCKEVLQHLSNEQIQLLLDRTAHYPRRLFTNTCHPSFPVNTDIETGDCRAVDLTLEPFNQPARTVFTYGHWIVQEL